MSLEKDVTQWIDDLKQGDEDAVTELWKEYFERLVRLARKRLAHTNRRTQDEEDVALSAFNSFYQGVTEGRFPQLQDRDDLWKLLVVITTRKSFARVKYNQAAKRGAGVARGESVFRSERQEQLGIEQVLGEQPTPEFAVMVAETCDRLLENLEPTQRQIAIAKMEGYTNDEIAAQLGISSRAVTRKLGLIRKRWVNEAPI